MFFTPCKVKYKTQGLHFIFVVFRIQNPKIFVKIETHLFNKNIDYNSLHSGQFGLFSQ